MILLSVGHCSAVRHLIYINLKLCFNSLWMFTNNNNEMCASCSVSTYWITNHSEKFLFCIGKFSSLFKWTYHHLLASLFHSLCNTKTKQNCSLSFSISLVSFQQSYFHQASSSTKNSSASWIITENSLPKYFLFIIT